LAPVDLGTRARHLRAGLGNWPARPADSKASHRGCTVTSKLPPLRADTCCASCRICSSSGSGSFSQPSRLSRRSALSARNRLIWDSMWRRPATAASSAIGQPPIAVGHPQRQGRAQRDHGAVAPDQALLGQVAGQPPRARRSVPKARPSSPVAPSPRLVCKKTRLFIGSPPVPAPPPGNQARRAGPPAVLDARHTQLLAVVDEHAVQALETLVVIDRAAPVYGLVGAIAAAALAGLAAFGAARIQARRRSRPSQTMAAPSGHR
jgi:hypothetical protein